MPKKAKPPAKPPAKPRTTKPTGAKVPAALKKVTKYVTPAQHQTIVDRLCQQATFGEVASELGLSERLVKNHWQQQIAPVLRSGAFRSAEFQLAKLDSIEREAWRHFRGEGNAQQIESIEKMIASAPDERKMMREVKRAIKTSGQSAWLSLILEVWDRRCEILGVNSRSLRLVDDGGGELYRVAGADPSEIDDGMVDKVIAVLNDIRSVRQARVNQDGLTIEQETSQ